MPRAERQEHMLDVAGRLFAERGFHETSMDDVAEGAEISKPMVYAYFESKEGLYSAYFERASRRMLEALDASEDPTLGAEEQLWRAALAFFGFVSEHRQAWEVLQRELAVPGGRFAAVVAETRASITRRTSNLLARTLTEQGVEGDADALATAFIGAGDALASWWVAHPELDREALAARLMQTGWLGLRQVSAGERFSPAG